MKYNNVEEEPLLIAGDVSVDDRGDVGYVNDFDMKSVRRLYTVSNHKQGFVRAWHAHRKECKYVTVVNGSAVIACVKIDDWENPSKDANIIRFILTAVKPSVVYIPSGYANGFMNLTADAKIIFFSNSTLEESLGDDVRYDANYWNPWQVIER